MRPVILVLMSILISAAAPYKDDVTAHLRPIHAFFAEKTEDPFVDPPPLGMEVGTRFEVQFPFLDSRRKAEDGGSSSWAYADGILTLSITPENVGLLGRAHMNGPAIFYRVEQERLGTYQVENAFGTRRLVESFSARQFGIFLVSRPVGEFSRFLKDYDRKVIEKIYSPEKLRRLREEYYYRARLAGAEAKRLTEDAIVQVEGRVTTAAGGRSWDCETIYSGPKVNFPNEVTTNRCWIAANVERVAIIDTANDRILAEWRLD